MAPTVDCLPSTTGLLAALEAAVAPARELERAVSGASAIAQRLNVITGEWIELAEPLFVGDDTELQDWLQRTWADSDEFEYRVYCTEGVPRS